MLGRLLIGIVKGLIVGGLVGFGLVKLGFIAPGAIVAYLAAALTGVLVGLVAGKPIWAKDAKIEAGMKAFVGALLGAGLMYAVRRWLTAEVPVAINGIVSTSDTLGGHAMTSLAIVAAVLGGFYEADNTPEPAGEAKAEPSKPAQASNKRIAANLEFDEDDEASVEADPRRAKK